MFSIVPKFDSLKAYVDFTTLAEPKALKPRRCSHCGKNILWSHGSYPRKADRENYGKDSLNPIPIFRYYCPSCRHTCSVLPECIPPRRWYLWSVQQMALLLIILEHSYRYIAHKVPPARTTIRRWYNRFKERFPVHSLHLCSRFPELGASLTSFSLFWKTCLEQMSLDRAMVWLHLAGETIP